MDVEAENSYEYDEMWDINDFQFSCNEPSILNRLGLGETGAHAQFNPENFLSGGSEDAWDSSWDLDSASFSRIACSSEIEVWSVHLPDEDAFYEIIEFKCPNSSVSQDEPQLEYFDPIVLNEDLLSENAKQILARPPQYSTICDNSPAENQNYSSVHSGSQRAGKNFDITPISSPTPNSLLFDSVESIMHQLDLMPSLTRKYSLPVSKSNLVCYAENPTPATQPSEIKQCCEVTSQMSNMKQITLNFQRSKSVDMHTDAMPVCQQQYSYQSINLVIMCQFSLNSPIIIGIGPGIVSGGLGTRRDVQLQNIFDPGGS